jgi:hypothetical protein
MAIHWLELRAPVLPDLPLVEARDCDGLQPKTDLYSRTKWLTSFMPTDDITSLTERNDVSSSSRARLNRNIFTYCVAEIPISRFMRWRKCEADMCTEEATADNRI